MLPANPRARARLATELIIWLTTVRANGQPQVSPVWFIIDDDEFLVYSRPGVAKLSNIESNPCVALNLDGNGVGGDIVTLEGRARVVSDQPPAHEVPAFVAKYAERIERNGWTPESFASDYRVALRIAVTRSRTW
jgi:PPOX class probable F420-dependent enzyme